MSAPAALKRSGQVREVDRLDPPRWHHASTQLAAAEDLPIQAGTADVVLPTQQLEHVSPRDGC